MSTYADLERAFARRDSMLAVAALRRVQEQHPATWPGVVLVTVNLFPDDEARHWVMSHITIAPGVEPGSFVASIPDPPS